MRILYVTAELAPFLKTGGLADVSAALPPALRELGVDARLLVPGFPALRDGIAGQRRVAALQTPFGPADVMVGAVAATGVPVYVLAAPLLFDRPGNPYIGPDGRDWPDNHRRFALLGWVAAHFRDGDWRPDIVHGHDWHAGLAPAYLRGLAGDGLASIGLAGGGPGSVLTIHNLAYQGNFPASVFGELALPAGAFAIDGVEFHNQVSFLKAGIFYSDRVTTVSPRYAAEIQTAEGGWGLDGILRLRSPVGILNGVDYREWSPETDQAIAKRYSAVTLARKAASKRLLQQEFKLALTADAPLFGSVSRLTWQKGLDVIVEALPELVALGGQFALVGMGDDAIENAFFRAAERYPGAVAFIRAYDERLAHMVIAGADVLTVPSRFEPCGLTQLYALRYGTLPLVRRVGGLADSVADLTPATLREGSATGFLFDAPTAAGFLGAARRAIAAYGDKRTWRKVQRRAMQEDFSWRVAAEHYIELYRGIRPVVHQPGAVWPL